MPADMKFDDMVMCIDCHPSSPLVASGCITGHVAL